MYAYQGNLDGLCGAYAITNAMIACGINDQQNIFQHACSALAKQRWPHVLWDGTHFPDLRNMAQKSLKTLGYGHVIEISAPFSKSVPKSNLAYWRAFDALFDSDPSACCAILGRTRPSLHWIVAYRDGGRIAFLDSNPIKPIVRKNRSSIFAGERHANKNAWLVDRAELLLFKLK